MDMNICRHYFPFGVIRISLTQFLHFSSHSVCDLHTETCGNYVSFSTAHDKRNKLRVRVESVGEERWARIRMEKELLSIWKCRRSTRRRRKIGWSTFAPIETLPLCDIVSVSSVREYDNGRNCYCNHFYRFERRETDSALFVRFFGHLRCGFRFIFWTRRLDSPNTDERKSAIQMGARMITHKWNDLSIRANRKC